jgi:hypothetical protein
MQHNFVVAILAVGIFIGQSVALGINCRGSSTCGRAKTQGAVNTIAGYIAGVQPCRNYKNGEHIACINDGNVLASNGGFCAFLQGTASGAVGADINAMIQSLNNRTDDHCNNCGSVPILFPPALGGSNDPKPGILTVNFVSNTDNPCPDGLC